MSSGRTRVYDFKGTQSRRATAMDWSPWPSEAWSNDAKPILLTVSNPDPTSLPLDDLRLCNERVLQQESAEFALMYGGTQGYLGLRDWLAFDVNRREGLNVTADNFVLTCGASGALENLCEALLDPGDVVFVERPTFPGSVSTMVSCLAEVVGVAMDCEGLDPEDLERSTRAACGYPSARPQTSSLGSASASLRRSRASWCGTFLAASSIG